MDTSGTKKVVVIGGGFAGINFIKTLWRKPGFEITLVDVNNYNFFSAFALSGSHWFSGAFQHQLSI